MSKIILVICIYLSCLSAPFCYSQEDLEYPKIKTQSVKVSDKEYVISKTIIKTSMSNIISLMTDTESYTEWLHFCVEATLLSKLSDSEGIFLFVYDTDSFWYKNRFLIAKAVVLQEESLDRLEYRLSEPDDPQMIQKHKPNGAVRIKSFDISWIFTRIDKDNILAEYKMSIDTGIPFGVSGYLKKMGHNTLIKFGKLVNTLKYSNSPQYIILEWYRCCIAMKWKA